MLHAPGPTCALEASPVGAGAGATSSVSGVMVDPLDGASLSPLALGSSRGLPPAFAARARAGAWLAPLGRLALDSSRRGPLGSRATVVGMGTRGRGWRTVSALMRCLSAAAFSAAAFCGTWAAQVD